MNHEARLLKAIVPDAAGHVKYISSMCLAFVANEEARAVESVSDLLFSIAAGISYMATACLHELQKRLVLSAVSDVDKDGPRGILDAFMAAVVNQIPVTIDTVLNTEEIDESVDAVLKFLRWLIRSQIEASVAWHLKPSQYVPSPPVHSLEAYQYSALCRVSSSTLDGDRGTHRFAAITEQLDRLRTILAHSPHIRLNILRQSVLSITTCAPQDAPGLSSFVVSCHGFRWDTQSASIPGVPGVRQSARTGGGSVYSTTAPHPSTLSAHTDAVVAVERIISRARAVHTPGQTMSLSMQCVAPVRVLRQGAWVTVHFADEIGGDGGAAHAGVALSTTARVTIEHFIPRLVASGLFHSFQISDLTGSLEFDLLHGYHQVRVN